MDERGPLCRCGKRGGLDSYAAIPAILDALAPQHGPLTVTALLGLLARGDPGAVRVVSDAADVVRGALGARSTALGAIALALGESDWLPAAIAAS